MGAIDDIIERKAAAAQQRADLAEFSAMKKALQENDQSRAMQDAYDLGAADVESILSQREAYRNKGVYGATVSDAAFGTGSPKGAMSQKMGGDIPSWLADTIIGAGDAVSSGMDTVSSFFMDAALPTPEEDANNAALGSALEKSMSQSSTWKPSAPLNENSPEVSKEEMKRFSNIFYDNKKGPMPLTDEETNNAYVLMKSDKDFTDDEIRSMAKNK